MKHFILMIICATFYSCVPPAVLLPPNTSNKGKEYIVLKTNRTGFGSTGWPDNVSICYNKRKVMSMMFDVQRNQDYPDEYRKIDIDTRVFEFERAWWTPLENYEKSNAPDGSLPCFIDTASSAGSIMVVKVAKSQNSSEEESFWIIGSNLIPVKK